MYISLSLYVYIYIYIYIDMQTTPIHGFLFPGQQPHFCVVFFVFAFWWFSAHFFEICVVSLFVLRFCQLKLRCLAYLREPTGNLRRTYGHLRGTYGEPTGNLRAPTGNLRAPTGNLRAPTGNLRGTYGEPTGNLRGTYGELHWTQLQTRFHKHSTDPENQRKTCLGKNLDPPAKWANGESFCHQTHPYQTLRAEN